MDQSVAAAVLSMFVVAGAPVVGHAAETTKVFKCAGINECKGKSACGGSNNACHGQNSCKGKGWIVTKTEKECTDKGGKVIK